MMDYDVIIRPASIDDARHFYARKGAIEIEGSECEILIDGRPYKEVKYVWHEL